MLKPIIFPTSKGSSIFHLKSLANVFVCKSLHINMETGMLRCTIYITDALTVRQFMEYFQNQKSYGVTSINDRRIQFHVYPWFHLEKQASPDLKNQ